MMMNEKHEVRYLFDTHTLHTAPWGDTARRLLNAALHAIDPAAAVQRVLQRSGDLLTVGSQSYNLADYMRVLVVGAGKAGIPMTQGVASVLRDVLFDGLVVVKDEGNNSFARLHAVLQDCAPVALVPASHPIPDERSLAATRSLTAMLAQTTEHDLVLFLLSGGASSLLTLPVPAVSLFDVQRTTDALLASGATIAEINTIRKHLDQVKGGGLAHMTAPATLLALILSDVVGNPLSAIGSGPTAPDTTSFADAAAILKRYPVLSEVPESVVEYIAAGERGEHLENLRADDLAFAHVQNVLVGSNQHAAQAVAAAAREAGLHTLVLSTYMQGEAREVGRMLASMARELATGELVGSSAPYTPFLQRPACVIVGGETTVTLHGTGYGGRNQELALAAVRDMAGLPDVALLTLATDGGDGPTDAAGAVVTGETLARAQERGLHVETALAHNDSYPFFDALGDLLRPGPTGTNAGDLALLFAW